MYLCAGIGVGMVIRMSSYRDGLPCIHALFRSHSDARNVNVPGQDFTTQTETLTTTPTPTPKRATDQMNIR